MSNDAPTHHAFSRYHPTTVVHLLAVMGLCLIYLQFRNAGLYVIGPDEWHYSRSSRLQPLASVEFTSYLYFLIYRATSICGNGFLDCARTINGLFLVGAMPFIYLVARLVANRPLALLVAVLAVFGPVNTYTALFMPETLYYFLFWLMAWYALRDAAIRPLLYGAGLGVILGLMGLVKQHALFLVPAIVLFMALRYLWSGTEQRVLKAVVVLGVFFASAALVRFGLGYLLAGASGLSLFGEFYGSFAQSAADARRSTELIWKALFSLKGHGMGLAALFAFPLAALFYFPKTREGPSGAPRASLEIRLLAILVLACLLLVTTLFSAKVAGANEMETIARLHMRYYLFALPLLLIIAAEQAGSSSPLQLARALPTALLSGTLAVLAIFSLTLQYVPGFVDSPELWGIAVNVSIFRIIVGLGLLALIAWLYKPSLGARIFLFFVFPLIVVVSSWRANDYFGRFMRSDTYAQAGLFARQYLGDESEPVLVVGSDHSSTYRAMFYLDRHNVTKLLLPTFAAIPESSVPPETRWILVIGAHALPKGGQREAGFGGFSLARVGAQPALAIEFTQSSWPGINMAGLSVAEAWGTWSDGTRVEMEFSRPLPSEFTLRLKARTIGNTSEPSTIVVGKERRELRLPTPQELSIPFKTDGSVHTISFEIPWAKTFKEKGIASPDMRRLGIGFEAMSIIPTASTEVSDP